ncbi:MAG: sodium/glutamate symporter [Planctomycetota bacterium]|nr:sodium/glutamate symporter [Planctomycetota bacterium]
MTAAFLFVAVLSLLGVILRAMIPIFRWLYIPASVIAGAIGFGVIQFAPNWSADWSATLRSWPGWLIAVVFAGMLLERKPASLKKSASRVGRQGLMVWVIVVGQSALGLLATWLLVQPFYEVPNSFGMLIETGFAGGHGTAAAMGQVFAHPKIDLQGGSDLGVLMATCGLVFGIVSGILWVNLGARMKWIGKAAGEVSAESQSEQVDQSVHPPIGYARISNAVMDPLLLQVVWLTLAMGIGIALQQSVAWGAGEIESWFVSGQTESQGAEGALSQRMTLQSVIDSFPLFIYTLFGGLIVRQVLRVLRQEDSIDRETINHLTATAMDVLVVAAIASLNVTAVATLLVPFSILFVVGVIWAGFCLLILARWLLPSKHWFQLGLINYGMSTGTTATGFVLLRLVDPELESGAAEDYALAAPLSSPFVGGGMITVGLPLLVLERIPIGLSAIGLILVVTVMIAIGRRWNGVAKD